jgi:hypothetical protein
LPRGRPRKGNNTNNGNGYDSNDESVNKSRINKWRNLLWVKNTLGSKTPDGSDLLDEDIANLIRLREQQQNASVEKKQKQRITRERALPQQTYSKLKVTERKVDVGVKKYLQYYDMPAPNDMHDLRTLVRIELTIPLIDAELDTLRGSTDPDATKTFSALTLERKNLQTENRELQKVLGIGKSIRDEMQRDRSAVDEIQEMVLAAKEFLAEQVVLIVCPNCHTEAGWLYNLFRELDWKIELNCGCGARLAVRTGVETPDVISLVGVT